MSLFASEQAIAYAWEQLLQRAGLETPEAVRAYLYYGLPDNAPQHARIVVVPASKAAWHQLLSLEPRQLPWTDADTALPQGKTFPQEKIPVLFWSTQTPRIFAQYHSGRVVFNSDLLAATLFMLTRWEEAQPTASYDQHGRFPARKSVAFKQGFLDRPIVDEYALILRHWLQVLFPDLPLRPPKFQVKPTHDIDHVRVWQTSQQMKIPAPTLAKPKRFQDLGRLLPMWGQGLAAFLHPPADPYVQGIQWLAQQSEKVGLKSTFFFMSAQQRTPYDEGYSINARWLRKLLQNLHARGHEIGWHPSYFTAENEELFFAEKQALENALQAPIVGGRQHYLRFRAPHTWRMWERAGMLYDATLGYADQIGFRGGTCHPYHPFDWEQNRTMKLLEFPLIAMDVTLKNQLGLSPQEAMARVLSLARQCRPTGGTMTLLWHNTSLHGDWHPWRRVYQETLKTLANWAHADKAL